MDNHKQLVTTVRQTIYQRENLVDKIQFLFPQKYENFNLSEFTATLKYVDQANVPHSENLQLQEELYKDRLRYFLPLDTSLTKFAGDIEIRITLSKVDLVEKKQYVLHTGTAVISVSPLKDYYAFSADESLEIIDQIVGQLDAKIEAVEKIAETYDMNKADNITYEESKLQLTSNGQKIGDAITIIGGDIPGEDSEFEVVEF